MQCISEDLLGKGDRQIFPGHAQNIISVLSVDKYRLLRDRVLQQADIRAAAKAAVHVFIVVEVRLGIIFQDKLLVAGAGSLGFSKIDNKY